MTTFRWAGVAVFGFIFFVSLPLMNQLDTLKKQVDSGEYSSDEAGMGLLLDPLYQKGMDEMACQEYDKALATFAEVIRQHPRSAYAYLGRGEVHVARGDFDRAIADFDEAVRLDPKNAYAARLRDTARVQREKRADQERQAP